MTFCPSCDVDLGLHPTDEPWGCDAARARAELMDRFWRISSTPSFAPDVDAFGGSVRSEPETDRTS